MLVQVRLIISVPETLKLLHAVIHELKDLKYAVVLDIMVVVKNKTLHTSVIRNHAAQKTTQQG